MKEWSIEQGRIPRGTNSSKIRMDKKNEHYQRESQKTNHLRLHAGSVHLYNHNAFLGLEQFERHITTKAFAFRFNLGR